MNINLNAEERFVSESGHIVNHVRAVKVKLWRHGTVLGHSVVALQFEGSSTAFVFEGDELETAVKALNELHARTKVTRD
jgi:hypothetical protein